ncbi:MAG TPA: hypothetical protein VJT49_14210 [Amycolatopsis sp.]|uniref:hypothetical protein n=1 Tax=Amycolatopsis sp. TaxID=37632 RepID=UPI002B48490C|nr:hypothetical protein [Amycolatopsis sp.]HKS46235.1 hypothetical protein [Amycolatopsis sp.]
MESRLQDLIDRGYRFIHPRDGEGRVIAVVGIRPHHSVVDVVRINAEDDVVASRMPGDEMDVLDPAKVLWRRAGRAEQVLDELLALPDQEDSAAGKTIHGCWVPGEGGMAKWMAATG